MPRSIASRAGFKILLDILASGAARLRVAEVPYTFRSRHAGASKLDELVVWSTRCCWPTRPSGAGSRAVPHLRAGGRSRRIRAHGVLATLLKGTRAGFGRRSRLRPAFAMVFNFAVNNVLTYRDRRLHGWRGGGLASFMAPARGALANVGIATTFSNHGPRVPCRARGRAVGRVELRRHAALHLGRKAKPA